MADLAERLADLRGELEWPQTPVLEPRAAEAPARPRRRRRSRRTLALAAGLALVLAGGVTAAVVLRLDGATVERRTGPAPSPPPAAELYLGPRVSLADAPFEPLLPARAGEPASVHLRDGIELGLAYPPAPGRPEASTTGLGLLVTEFRGDLHPAYVGKTTYEATAVERLRIGGEPAIWLEGAPHFFFYRPPGQDLSERELRLAANVLLLERGRLLVRLEGAFDRAEALALARSLRPGTDLP